MADFFSSLFRAAGPASAAMFAGDRQAQIDAENDREKRRKERMDLLQMAILEDRANPKPYDPTTDPEVLREEEMQRRGVGRYTPEPAKPPTVRYNRDGISFDSSVPQGVDPFTHAMSLGGEQPKTFKVAGREFPDTPEGQQAALQWERQLSAAGRAPRATQAGGGGSVRPPTEVQTRAMLGLSTAEDALRVLEEYDRAPGLRTKIADLLPVGGNMVLSDEDQQMMQASESLATAILRMESGAAVTEDEARRYARIYLPQPFDKPEVRAAKLQAARKKLDAMRQIAGPHAVRYPENPYR